MSRDDVDDALRNAEEYRPDGGAGVLVDLVTRAKRDVGEAFTPDAVEALASLRQSDEAAYQSMWADLKSAGVPVRDLKKAVTKAAMRVIRGGDGPASGDVERAGPYSIQNSALVWSKSTPDGSVDHPLANFAARIVREEIRDDGVERHLFLRIEGQLQGGRPLVPLEVASERFASLSWVLGEWGAPAVIYAGQTHDHLRAAIQMISGTPPREHVYTHLGWREIDGESVYLHVGGAIGSAGSVPDVKVMPPGALDRYELPDPPEGEELRECVLASLGLLKTAPDRISIVVFAAIYRSVLGSALFTIFLVGFTGAGKSVLAALAQAHFGRDFDLSHLPESWSSTENAIEGVAFAAKDALLIVDDFAPEGGRFDTAALQRKASRVLRAQGNRSGRSRMRPDGSLRPSREPRGLILSTGEDLPSSQSVRARCVVVDVGQPDVLWDEVSTCQEAAREGRLAGALAGFLRWVADQREEALGRLTKGVSEWREASLEHRRSAESLGQLEAAFLVFLDFAKAVGAIDESEVTELKDRALGAFLTVGRAQAQHQRAADPVLRFLDLLAAALASGSAHVADAGSGGPPSVDAKRWGWSGDEPSGRRIGWVDGDDLYLLPDVAYGVAEDLAAKQNLSLGLLAQTLWKRINERSLLKTHQSGRLTIQPCIGGYRQRVLHFRSDVLHSETGVSGADGAAGSETAPPAAGATSGTDSGTSPEPEVVPDVVPKQREMTPQPSMAGPGTTGTTGTSSERGDADPDVEEMLL